MTLPVEQERIWQEFDALHRELGGDVLFFSPTRRHLKSQHWRRAFCRAVAAYLEAMTAWMARYTILSYYPGELGDGERQTLEARLSALERTFHAIDLFTNTAGVESPLVRGSADWHVLTTMIRIRNRVVHPKRAEDACLSDDDLCAVYRAARVVRHLFIETLNRSGRALLRRAHALRCSELPRRDAPPKSLRFLS